MRWPIREADTNFLDVAYIHPLKRDAIAQLVQSAAATPIQVIEVFGSTVDGRCTPYSDIDIVTYGDGIESLDLGNTEEWDIHRAEGIPAGCDLWGALLKEGAVVYVSRALQPGDRGPEDG